MFSIQKSFPFAYAHRVYTQDVNSSMAQGDGENTCKHIHGHNGALIVSVSSDHLDYRGFVVDYKELGFIKSFVNKYLDHKLILGKGDPLLKHILPKDYYLEEIDHLGIYKIKTKENIDLVFQEFLNGITIVDLVPTSENLAQWCKYQFNKVLLAEIEAKNKSLAENTVFINSVGWSETNSTTAFSLGIC